MTTRATAGLSAGVLILAGLLAGCGDDGDDGGNGGGGDGQSAESFADQSYEEIKQAALDAMASLEALHLDVEAESEGQSVAFALSMNADGNCTGTISFGEASAEVLRADGEGWYKPNPELLGQLYPDQVDAAVEFVGDRWVVDTDDEVTGENCDLEGLIDQLSDDEEETNTEVVGIVDLDGQDVVQLDYTNAEGDGSAYILADGEHYLVKVESTGEESSTALLSGFNEDVSTEAPAEDEVVDLADFQG